MNIVTASRSLGCVVCVVCVHYIVSLQGYRRNFCADLYNPDIQHVLRFWRSHSAKGYRENFFADLYNPDIQDVLQLGQATLSTVNVCVVNFSSTTPDPMNINTAVTLPVSLFSLTRVVLVLNRLFETIVLQYLSYVSCLTCFGDVEYTWKVRAFGRPSKTCMVFILFNEEPITLETHQRFSRFPHLPAVSFIDNEIWKRSK